ncbi:pre-mRNA-splicing factor ATP-dependent RNA helicase DHX16 [Nematocida minor]|uniref:pre-mRNA-splicing factor ATP-dependent RNA helicase DHX16 n=1 Tax=Nematocida minor TaxID=1912983 RepID=UPI002220963E|nr:pre-mRNA-splicing factor ATP-dependent RNA helicase DHX16 [Nematocida minor]KAI5189445.1 pre-mRNA-splicing factor ATP-dependent RNA helicase DHX16 [Nematocida minor]
MGNKKKKLLQKYLEKKERQKERDSLVEQLKSLQKRPEGAEAKNIKSTSQLTRKNKTPVKEIRKDAKNSREKTNSKEAEVEHTVPAASLAYSYSNDGIEWKRAEKRKIESAEEYLRIKQPKEEKRPAQLLKTSKLLSRVRSVNSILPITHMEDEIVSSVKENHITIISGGTGSGKSTQVPQFLYENGLAEHKKICITQPRRVSTQAVCRRISEEQKSKVGDVCGYKMRYESKVSDKTEIIVMTEGVLLQELSEDPFLSKYSVVVLDEVHERSLCQDTILLVLAKIAVKSTLRVVLMSASVTDEYIEAVQEIAGVSIKRVEVEPQQYEVEVHYLQLGKYHYLEEMARRIEALEEKDGSILAFVSTKEETERLKESLKITKKSVHSLHSDTPEKAQEIILSSSNSVIIATNVAETSLTLPDVKYVVDGGREIKKKYNYENNSYTFETALISKESSEQRKGRTGRVGTGVCYRIYTTVEYERMRQNREPEMERERVLPMISSLLKAGVTPNRIDRVQCITRPPAGAIDKELCELKRLSIVGENELTEFGKKVLSLPVNPVLGAALMRIYSRSPEYLGYMLNIVASIELYENRKVEYTPAYVADTKTYIEVLSRQGVSESQKQKLLNHIKKSLIKISPNSTINKSLDGKVSSRDSKAAVVCGKVLAWCLAGNIVTSYNGKYYHKGQEVSVRTPLPVISSDKPVPILYYSLVYPDSEDTSKVALVGSLIPEH